MTYCQLLQIPLAPLFPTSAQPELAILVCPCTTHSTERPWPIQLLLLNRVGPHQKSVYPMPKLFVIPAFGRGKICRQLLKEGCVAGTTVPGSSPTHSTLASGCSSSTQCCPTAWQGREQAEQPDTQQTSTGAPCPALNMGGVLEQSGGDKMPVPRRSLSLVSLTSSTVLVIDCRWLGKSLLNIHLADGR